MLEIRVFFLFFLVALARGYQLCWSSKEASLAPSVFSVIFLVSSPLIFHSFYAFLSPDWFPLSSFSSSSCFLKVGAKHIDLRTSFLMQAFPRSTAPDARHKFWCVIWFKTGSRFPSAFSFDSRVIWKCVSWFPNILGWLASMLLLQLSFSLVPLYPENTLWTTGILLCYWDQLYDSNLVCLGENSLWMFPLQ